MIAFRKNYILMVWFDFVGLNELMINAVWLAKSWWGGIWKFNDFFFWKLNCHHRSISWACTFDVQVRFIKTCISFNEQVLLNNGKKELFEYFIDFSRVNKHESTFITMIWLWWWHSKWKKKSTSFDCGYCGLMKFGVLISKCQGAECVN